MALVQACTVMCELRGNTFSGNTAQGDAGAVYAAGATKLILLNNTFTSNSAGRSSQTEHHLKTQERAREGEATRFVEAAGTALTCCPAVQRSPVEQWP